VVRRRYPEVARAIDSLSTYGTVRLTGTGASIFMVCEPALARKIVGNVPAGYDAFVVRGLNDSPLLERSAA
jgi:4-diphosphocytidyl-2-C-methyl-D-erythritol kinase